MASLNHSPSQQRYSFPKEGRFQFYSKLESPGHFISPSNQRYTESGEGKGFGSSHKDRFSYLHAKANQARKNDSPLSRSFVMKNPDMGKPYEFTGNLLSTQRQGSKISFGIGR